MHSFTSLIIILLINIHFRKKEFTAIQNVFHESCKICMFDIYETVLQFGKVTTTIHVSLYSPEL
jgi:hypothetical protein